MAKVTPSKKRVSLKELQTLPGVGEKIAEELYGLGIRSVAGLKGRDPEKLYTKLCLKNGATDRCVLYVFRCAAYFASHKKHDRKKLKWWNRKD